MCEQNAFWFSDRKSLCAVMHPCFVSGVNLCLKFRKKFVVEWLVFITNLNSQVRWYNYDFPQFFQRNSAMLLQTIHNSILLYSAYNLMHIIISAFDAIELMELTDCCSLKLTFCNCLKYTSNIGDENGHRLPLMPGNIKHWCPIFWGGGGGDGHIRLLWASSRALGLKIILPKLLCIFLVYVVHKIFTIYIYINYTICISCI